MKTKQLINLTLALLVFATQAFAQSDKIAFVDTNDFIQPQKGIARLLKAIENVEQEFAPRRAEIAKMYERLQKDLEKFSYAGPIPTDPRPMTPERRKSLKEAADAMQRTIEQREEETRVASDQRIKEATAAVAQDIRTHLQSFARSRGITLLLDASRLACMIGCDRKSLAALDVTHEFIAEFNRLYP